jgi:hypothetical protein
MVLQPQDLDPYLELDESCGLECQEALVINAASSWERLAKFQKSQEPGKARTAQVVDSGTRSHPSLSSVPSSQP